MSKNVKKVKKVKKVTFSEECFTSKECPEERPHCIKTTTGEEGRNIVGNCGKGYLDDKWLKEAYGTHEKPYNYGGYYYGGLDPGKIGEYDIEGNLISSFINPHYKPKWNKRKRRDEWWKGGKKKKRTRKRRRKKRRRTRKRRRTKKRRKRSRTRK